MLIVIVSLLLFVLSSISHYECFTFNNQRFVYPSRLLSSGHVEIVPSTNEIVTIAKQWNQAITNASKDYAWFCTGKVASPAMKVAGNVLRFPLPADVDNLKAVATVAPFGKGSQTVVDEKVRKGLQIDPSLVEFTSTSSWNKKLQTISQELCNAYNEPSIKLTFYKMLLYEEGGHFAAHKDTLRDKNHIASLLISLPVEGSSEGGVLTIKDVEGHASFNWTGISDDSDASWCSFYTDCEHELQPLTAGKRVVLSYEVHKAVPTESEIKMAQKASSKYDSIEDDGEDYYDEDNYDDNANNDEGESYVSSVKIGQSEQVVMSNSTVPIDPMLVIDQALTLKDNVLVLLKHMYPSDCEAKHLKGFDRSLYETINSRYGGGDMYEVQLETMKMVDATHIYQPDKTRELELSLEGDTLLDSSYGECWSGKFIKEKMTGRNVYFDTEKFVCLFNSKDFKGNCISHDCGSEFTGNESAPYEYVYKFYVIRISKLMAR